MVSGSLSLPVKTRLLEVIPTEPSDGESYVPLVVSMAVLQRVIAGERAVTTVSQLLD